MDAEPTRATAPVAIVTYALIAINVVMFAVELALGLDAISPKPSDLVRVGGNLPALTLNGEPWRLASSMFLHAGLLHLGLNMLCLYQGRVVEQLYGRLGFLAIYITAGLGGAIASVSRGHNTVSVGASGAVFGVFAAFGVVLYRKRTLLDTDAMRRSARQLASFFAINLFIGFSRPEIDMSAHVGGIVAGACAALMLTQGARAATRRTVRAIAVTVVAIGLAVAVVVALPSPTDPAAPLHDIFTAEDAALGHYNKLVVRGRAHELTDTQFADALETEILPEWRALQAKQDAVTDPPARLVPVYAASRAYMAAVQHSWELRIAAIREGNSNLAAIAAAEKAVGAARAELEKQLAAGP